MGYTIRKKGKELQENHIYLNDIQDRRTLLELRRDYFDIMDDTMLYYKFMD